MVDGGYTGKEKASQVYTGPCCDNEDQDSECD